MTALERFAPVTLGDLVTEAALLTRVDRKYVVPRHRVNELLHALDPATRVLQIEAGRTFAYESVYFDTPDLLSFHMAAHPRRRRFKLRTRRYLDTGGAFLEIKTRGARGTTVKDREPYDPTLTDRLTADAQGDVADALDAIGVRGDRAHELQPTLVTRYRRATLLSPDGVGRATVDTDLEWLRPGASGFALPGTAIIETKSGAAASQVDRTLWRVGIRPSTVSKYATGLAALDDRLPGNRWARLLRGPFSDRQRAHPSDSFRSDSTRNTSEETSCPTAA